MKIILIFCGSDFSEAIVKNEDTEAVAFAHGVRWVSNNCAQADVTAYIMPEEEKEMKSVQEDEEAEKAMASYNEKISGSKERDAIVKYLRSIGSSVCSDVANRIERCEHVRSKE